jgi:hypothetical protein
MLPSFLYQLGFMTPYTESWSVNTSRVILLSSIDKIINFAEADDAKRSAWFLKVEAQKKAEITRRNIAMAEAAGRRKNRGETGYDFYERKFNDAKEALKKAKQDLEYFYAVENKRAGGSSERLKDIKSRIYVGWTGWGRMSGAPMGKQVSVTYVNPGYDFI